jgi:hypothetical protein
MPPSTQVKAFSFNPINAANFKATTATIKTVSARNNHPN